MSALIYVDLEALHPVVDGVWHRADLPRVPLPGEIQSSAVVLRDAFAHQRLRDRVQVLADRVLLRDLDF